RPRRARLAAALPRRIESRRQRLRRRGRRRDVPLRNPAERAAEGGPAVTRRIAVWIAAALIAAATAHAETLALVGGTVHPVSGPDLDGATVLVRDGKIVAVGRNLAVPAEARVVSCAGKQIYPGFVSANTVLGLTEIGSVSGTNDFRETGTINPDIRAEAQVNPESDLLPV